MEERQRKPHAIIIPFCFQGHITPAINLALKLASKGFTLTYIHTEFIHHSISKAHNHNSSTEVDFFAEARKSGLDIHYSTISDGFPPEFDRDLNFDEFWDSMFRDFPVRVDELVGKTIQSNPSSVYFLIADTFYSWPAAIAEKYSLVNVSLWTEPAIVFAIDYHLDLLRQNGHLPWNGDLVHQIDYIPGVQPISKRDLMSYLQDDDVTTTLLKIVIKGFEQVKKADFILCNTIHELESGSLSTLNLGKPTYAIGPINFDTTFTKISVAKSIWPESDCTQWLNSKPPGSVLYISFGSIAQSNKQDIGEIANALLLTGVNFIWILRPDIAGPDETDILPDGFNNRVKGRGLILSWCNQNIVLSHESVGGFITHCGWNSVLESIWYGVPMICYPFIADQPTNRKLVVSDWKIGINLCDGEQLTMKEVAQKINLLMSGKTSDDLKQEMKKVSKIMHSALDMDGSSQRNFVQFLENLKVKLYERIEEVPSIG
ncbi:UDP-glycosyltransferase 86A1-like [Olea europaea var. sylvestris]|uniref:UDP-glycosyltransferase 86A1-like n=1 Tax=Olea europaea var. sylvestris TaxID=158386 RepID=UPI000C1CD417|nr:UDP-glycosyltransferase 86A1-like [Olea europaea var. sylvestris]